MTGLPPNGDANTTIIPSESTNRIPRSDRHRHPSHQRRHQSASGQPPRQSRLTSAASVSGSRAPLAKPPLGWRSSTIGIPRGGPARHPLASGLFGLLVHVRLSATPQEELREATGCLHFVLHFVSITSQRCAAQVPVHRKGRRVWHVEARGLVSRERRYSY